jgi:hypothetical protein
MVHFLKVKGVGVVGGGMSDRKEKKLFTEKMIVFPEFHVPLTTDFWCLFHQDQPSRLGSLSFLFVVHL